MKETVGRVGGQQALAHSLAGGRDCHRQTETSVDRTRFKGRAAQQGTGQGNSRAQSLRQQTSHNRASSTIFKGGHRTEGHRQVIEWPQITGTAYSRQNWFLLNFQGFELSHITSAIRTLKAAKCPSESRLVGRKTARKTNTFWKCNGLLFVADRALEWTAPGRSASSLLLLPASMGLSTNWKWKRWEAPSKTVSTPSLSLQTSPNKFALSRSML
ncbi:hypothetical protein O6H91_15G039000 [Diphasiastrum complanatum]|uniref:Uncharacterized protein n=1 Tax=Diphasiastrum complanatum TaxID=34168 RepID=A0ACC2BIE0_DIPCM|nr:hypothetical protein O6H91_15G039000 [Diphasiastrum complanatum]